jgi:hypothetical protein
MAAVKDSSCMPIYMGQYNQLGLLHSSMHSWIRSSLLIVACSLLSEFENINSKESM